MDVEAIMTQLAQLISYKQNAEVLIAELREEIEDLKFHKDQEIEALQARIRELEGQPEDGEILDAEE